ncbi:protein of unknown function [Candidatus Nitrospira inopinata]|jgi:hypothetical protein|uniref:Uncharacterized protein n=1 Tax=Candidatus Nitrospira inopinata TaxID=1715989 RepID=A0A0S4KXW1_9BACT|nr:protein of unknown function [Candidatus Nitrospira inopinata]
MGLMAIVSIDLGAVGTNPCAEFAVINSRMGLQGMTYVTEERACQEYGKWLSASDAGFFPWCRCLRMSN